MGVGDWLKAKQSAILHIRESFASEKPIAARLCHADKLLQQAMFQLEDKFRAVIEQIRE
ncbi:hypothetical protein ACLOJK_028449 [Asimina triloba]